jgi:hypothetical protein
MGTLPVAVHPSISQEEDKITFNWEISASPVSEYHTDRTMLVIYFPDLGVTFCQLVGAKRVEGKEVVVISSEHINERMEAYISFVKDDGTRISNSVHAGSLNAVSPVATEAESEEETKNQEVTAVSGPVCETIQKAQTMDSSSSLSRPHKHEHPDAINDPNKDSKESTARPGS